MTRSVFVVTHGMKGAEHGEFFDEKAYVNIEDARAAAEKCRRKLGGPWMEYESIHEHVVQRWDNVKTHYLKAKSVWLERLFLEGSA